MAKRSRLLVRAVLKRPRRLPIADAVEGISAELGDGTQDVFNAGTNTNFLLVLAILVVVEWMAFHPQPIEAAHAPRCGIHMEPNGTNYSDHFRSLRAYQDVSYCDDNVGVIGRSL